jgi:hypothetical protein
VLTSNVSTGTAPFNITSTTPVTNLSIGGNAATATHSNTSDFATVASGTAISLSGSNANFYPTFVSGAGASMSMFAGAGLTFNPFTNDLSTTTFTGNLTGNVSGNSTTATNLAGPVALPNGTTATTQVSTDSSTYLATTAFVHSASGGGRLIKYTLITSSTVFSIQPNTSFIIVILANGAGGGGGGSDGSTAQGGFPGGQTSFGSLIIPSNLNGGGKPAGFGGYFIPGPGGVGRFSIRGDDGLIASSLGSGGDGGVSTFYYQGRAVGGVHDLTGTGGGDGSNGPLGGGGGGGGGTNYHGTATGGGGGASSDLSAPIVIITPLLSYSVLIGAGGVGGLGYAPGGGYGGAGGNGGSGFVQVLEYS